VARRLGFADVTNLPQLTTVPTVVAAIITAFEGIASDPAYGTLAVFDGPAFKTDAHDMIAVGIGTPSIEHQLVAQNRGVAYDEAYHVNCLMWSWTGSRVMADHRARCYTKLGAVRDALDAIVVDRVSVVRLGENLVWTQGTAGEGSSCSVQFSAYVAASL
jgi:hypothetical protein